MAADDLLIVAGEASGDLHGARLRLFLQLFFGLVGGGLVLAWVMYFFPSGPPTPFP